jgi:hypothetical protein
MGWVINITPRPFFPRERDPVPILQEAGWAQVAENIASTGIRFQDRPARSESLYRLRYPRPLGYIEIKIRDIEFPSVVIKSISNVQVQLMARQTKNGRCGDTVDFGVLLTVSLLRMEINTVPEHCSLNLVVHRKYLFRLRCLGFQEWR